MSVLNGSLELFALPDVFRLLSRNKVTGSLRVIRQSGDGVVYFREGEVYYAFSSLTREFLGQRLVNAKLITQGQLLRILDEQKKSGNRRLGDLLIDKGFISKDLLDTFLKEQIQDAVFDVMQWDVGEFTFDSGEVASQEVGLEISVENLIMEGSRRVEEWEVIRRKIPSMDVVVRLAPTPPENAMEINIKPEEWTLMVLADGTRTVREIAEAGERSEFETSRILYGLITAGLLDVGSAIVAAPREPLRAAPEPVAVPPSPTQVETPPPSVVEAAPEPVSEVAPEPVIEAAPEPVVEAPAAEPEPTAPEPAQAEPEVAEPVRPLAEARPPMGSGSSETSGPSGNGDGAVVPRAPVTAGRGSEVSVSKELLQRLIAGVQNL